MKKKTQYEKVLQQRAAEAVASPSKASLNIMKKIVDGNALWFHIQSNKAATSMRQKTQIATTTRNKERKYNTESGSSIENESSNIAYNFGHQFTSTNTLIHSHAGTFYFAKRMRVSE